MKARVGWHGLTSAEHRTTGPLLVTGTDFDNGRVNWATCVHVDDLRYEQDPNIQLRDGDLLITKDGTIGKLAVVADLPGPATLNSGVFVARPTTRSYTTRYLYWVLASDVFTQFALYRSIGSTIQHLYQDVFGEFAFPVPPVDVQESIADFLDRKTAAIDALIEKKEELLALLDKHYEAVLHGLVTKGLAPCTMRSSGTAWIGNVPAHWPVRRVKDVAKLESGHTPDKSNPAYWRDDNNIPWVSLGDSKALASSDYIDDTAFHLNELGLENSSAHILPARVVVFTRDATIGKAAITTRPMAVSQHIIAWVCGPQIVPEYLLFVFYVMEKDLVRFTMGATLRTIGMDDVKTIVTPVPPVAEQIAIVERSEGETRRHHTRRARMVEQIQRLREYRQALITAAVTGQIDMAKETAA